MKKIIIRRQKIHNLKQEATAAPLHPILQRIYEHRGIKTSTELNTQLTALLPYHSLKNIEAAAELLAAAIQQQQRLLIVGDFDADGATSTALAIQALRSFGAQQVHYLVPNRFKYGYGLTPEIVQTAVAWQPDVIITVDNGISSVEGVAAANALGIKVVITDHHLPGLTLPEATVIVNPNQISDPFPSKNLAGVGVIFYVMCALRRYLSVQNWFQQQNIAEPNMSLLLDLVALGTVADVVPLDQNNRILVQQGLQRIRAGQCSYGIKALLATANCNPQTINATTLGFVLGPRLNAAGRLDDMSLGIECLLADTMAQAQQYAQTLDQLNNERKVIEEDMKHEALKEITKLQLQQKEELPLGLCLYDQNWHQGVIGILASRLKDQYRRPVIAFAPGNGNEIKGSARSITGLHIRDMLDAVATQYPHLISKFGGHAMAAGLSLELEKLTEFTAAFDAQVRKHLKVEDLSYEIYSDGELQPEDFNLAFAELLQEAGPWGQNFPDPLFDGFFTVLSQRIVGGKHLKLSLAVAAEQGSINIDTQTSSLSSSQPQSLTDFINSNNHFYTKPIAAIVFNANLEQWPNHRCTTVRAAFKIDVNEYQGLRTIQLIVNHLEAL